MPEVRYVGGATYALRDGPTWETGDVHDVGEDTAARLTTLDKFESVDTADGPSPADAIADGVCPWCDDYEGDAVPQHASAAHPTDWAEYTAQRD